MHVGAGMDAQLLVLEAARTKASLLPRRCNPMPVQLPTLSIGTVILSHCAWAPRNCAAVETVGEPEMQRVDLPCVRLMAGGAADEVMHHVRHQPVGHEQAEDAAVKQRVAVKVGKALPGNDRLERRRLVVGDEPLIDRVIGDAGETDRAVAPGLRRRPFDRIVEVDELGERPRLALAGRLAAAAPVHPHRRIALRHPPLRVDGLPVHQRVRRFLQRIRRNPELVLLVGTEVENGGKATGAVRPKHVGLEHARRRASGRQRPSRPRCRKPARRGFIGPPRCRLRRNGGAARTDRSTRDRVFRGRNTRWLGRRALERAVAAALEVTARELSDRHDARFARLMRLRTQSSRS